MSGPCCEAFGDGSVAAGTRHQPRAGILRPNSVQGFAGFPNIGLSHSLGWFIRYQRLSKGYE
jgi:hypothetical protein